MEVEGRPLPLNFGLQENIFSFICFECLELAGLKRCVIQNLTKNIHPSIYGGPVPNQNRIFHLPLHNTVTIFLVLDLKQSSGNWKLVSNYLNSFLEFRIKRSTVQGLFSANLATVKPAARDFKTSINLLRGHVALLSF